MRNYFYNIRDTDQPSMRLVTFDFLQQVMMNNFQSKLVDFQYRRC